MGMVVIQSLRGAATVVGDLSSSSSFLLPSSCSNNKKEEEASSALGDGCYHVFLDVGANMGE